MKYKDQVLHLEQPHVYGQLFSGLLWDLYESEDYSSKDLTNTVYKSLSFLSNTTSFEEFMAALISADLELFKGKHCSLIREAATKRGMEELLPDAECPETSFTYQSNQGLKLNSDQPKYILAINDTIEANKFELTDNCEALSRSKRNKKKSGFLNCGSIGSDTSGNLAWLLILLMAPLTLLKRRK